ncbi:hypothetical protein [Wolbachia endosymbiont of Armadillidium arcangelii]|uniref:Uncharacterized protein n=1 Tax=Wolbachia endosymbiont of Armadillidium arcangelii TaxID=3158571 RepID=A0AAU7Q190_9RICK
MGQKTSLRTLEMVVNRCVIDKDEVHANKCRLHNAKGKAREYIEKQIEFTKKQLEQN